MGCWASLGDDAPLTHPLDPFAPTEVRLPEETQRRRLSDAEQAASPVPTREDESRWRVSIFRLVGVLFIFAAIRILAFELRGSRE